MHKPLSLICAAATLAGCAVSGAPGGSSVLAEAPATTSAFSTQGVHERDEPLLALRAVPARPAKGDVSLASSETEFSALMTEVARQSGYTIAFAEGVDVARRISVELRDARASDALRRLAFLAGYAAVIDESARTVYVAVEAAYTFKLPAILFAESLASYSVGSSREWATSTADASRQAHVLVTGREGGSSERLREAIKGVAGRNADVSFADNGIVVVRANAQALKRTHEFLKQLAADALAEVDIEAAVIALRHERHDDAARPRATAVAEPAFSVTTAPVRDVVSRLRQVARAQVVATPRLTVLNQRPATLFAEAAGGNAAFSVTAFVVNAQTTQLRLAPSVGAGGDSSRARPGSTAALVTINAQTGRTTVIRGLRMTDADAGDREFVIVLRANAVMARPYDPLIGESL